MSVIIWRASGRAHCRICKNKIESGDIDVIFTEYHSEKHHHFSCIEKRAKEIIQQVLTYE